MSVYDIKDLKKGVNAQGGDFATPGITNLYNAGYLLEIQHVPSGYKVKFPAFLENFSDAFTQSWNAEDVYGRMDPIAVYPSYSSQGANAGGTVLNMSPLLRVKFLNLIHNAATPDLGLLGYVNGFTVDVRSEEGMFTEGQGGEPAVYPKTITLNFELNVLHEHAMGWTSGKTGDPVLRQAKDGFPYKTDQPVPSTDSPPPTPAPTPPANQNSSTVQPGGGASEVLAGPGGSGLVNPGQE